MAAAKTACSVGGGWAHPQSSIISLRKSQQDLKERLTQCRWWCEQHVFKGGHTWSVFLAVSPSLSPPELLAKVTVFSGRPVFVPILPSNRLGLWLIGGALA